jgi:hypothetical protein
MAGDWIKMRTDLLTSPKVVRMASALKADRFRIVGGLLSVWSLFDAHSTDGVLSGYTLEALDDLAAWPGFSGAMIDVGWLDQEAETLALPRFDTHNGASAKRRAQDADRKKAVRKMSASDADEKRTREEKRREESNKPPLIPPAEKPEPAPRKSKIPTPFLMTAEMRAWAADSAPGVDLRTETEKFVDYWRAEAKTKADWPATWRNWMRKAQQDHNRPGPRGVGAPVNRQQQIEDENAKVVREMADRERERQRQLGQTPIDLGEAVTLDGEVIHAD